MSYSAKLEELYLPHAAVARIMLVFFNDENSAWHFKSINQAPVTSKLTSASERTTIFPSKAAHPRGPLEEMGRPHILGRHQDKQSSIDQYP